MNTQLKMLQLAVIISIVFAATCAAAEQMPSIDEILDKYTQALDSTQSFISEWEASHVGSCNIPEWGMRYSNVKSNYRGMYRTDNKGRSYEKYYRWGYVDASHPDTPEEQAVYTLNIIGDTFTYDYGRRLKTDNKGTLQYREEGKPGWDIPERKTWGYLNLNDTNNLFLGYVQMRLRLDTILKNAERISLSQKPVMINGSVCYVVTADTRYGTFKVWFDSEHGYHPAKLQTLVNVGDDNGDPDNPHIITPEEGVQRRYTMDNVRFEKIDDVWVPMEADRTRYNVLGSPEKFASGKTHFKYTKIILNPDHDALGSFADPMKNPSLNPELINGCIVTLGDGTRWTLQDGNLIPMKEEP